MIFAPNCERCGLNPATKVSPEGPGRAALAIVGEAPGAVELRLGRPFVGPSGQLLERALAEAGLRREEVHVTNACLCDPGGTPKATNYMSCRPRLIEELKTVQPRVVLAVGNIATRTLLRGEKRITQVRGDIIQNQELGVPVVPTYHPAAVLRTPSLWQDFLRDVKKAANISRGASITVRPEVSYRVIEGPEELEELLDSRLVALDTETRSDGSLLCLGMAARPDRVLIAYPEKIRSDVLRRIFETKTIVAHNWKFDQKVLAGYGALDMRPKFEDTMLMAYSLDERRGKHGLKYLSREYLGVPDYTREVNPYMDAMENCPPEALHRYNALDVSNTLQLYHELSSKMGDRHRKLLRELLYPASDALALMEYRGVMVDMPYLEELQHSLEKELEETVNRLHALAGVEFNPNSPKQVAHVLYEVMKLPIPIYMTTNAAALELLVNVTGNEVPKLLLHYRDRHKFLGTYVKALLQAADRRHRVHTNFNIIGTVTGRLSSSDPVNLQNIPRTPEARNMFRASEGATLINIDLSQAEIRAICWLARDEALRRVLLSGEDLHTKTASMMFGIPPENVSKEQRIAAKRLNFGIIYGISAKTLAKELGTSVREAEKVIQRLFAVYPGVKGWIDETRKKVLLGEQIYTPFGRTRHFDLITPDSKEEILRQAVNFPVQSLSADITLSALIRLDKRIRRGDFGRTQLLLTVHDSILLETWEEDVPGLANALREEVERPVLDDWLPFLADAEYGPKWGTMTKVERI